MTSSISEESSGIGSTRTANESVRSTDDSTEATTMRRRKSHPVSTKAVGSKPNSRSNSNSNYTTTRQDENEIIVVGSEDEDENDTVSIATRMIFQGSTTTHTTFPLPLESSKPLRKPTPLATALDPLVLTSSDEDEDEDDDGLVQAATAEIAAMSSSKTEATTTKPPQTVGSSQLRGTKRGRTSSTISVGQDTSAKVKQEDRASRMNPLSFSDSEQDDDDDDLLFGNGSAFGRVRNTLQNLLKTETKPLGKVRNTQPPPKALPITDTKSALDDKSQKVVRLRHLEEITNEHDRALQLLLWEIGFGYNIYAHQFEATRFVAGLVPTFPVPSSNTKFAENVAASMLEQSANGTHYRSEALKMTALEFSSRLNNNNKNNNNIPAGDDSRFIFTLPTKGMLLADEMGLGTHAHTYAFVCVCLQSAFCVCSLSRCCDWCAWIRFSCGSAETHATRLSPRFTLLTLHVVK